MQIIQEEMARGWRVYDRASGVYIGPNRTQRDARVVADRFNKVDGGFRYEARRPV